MASNEERDYWDSVESIAEEAKSEYPDPRRDHDGRVEWISESVDGSQWIIYTYKNEIVINATDNESDGEEVAEMAGPGADWRKQRMVAAFMAMERDVWDKLRELDKKEG